MVAALLAALGSTPAVNAKDQPKLVVGLALMNALGTNQEAGLIGLLKDTIAVFNARAHYNLEVKVFLNQDEYYRAINEGNLAIALSQFVLNSKTGGLGYNIFMQVTMLGQNYPEECVYVRKDDPATKLSELRGRVVSAQDQDLVYYILRNLIGEPPEVFFRTPRLLKDDTSGLYALALKTVSVLVAKKTVVKFLEMTNPGPVKNLREIACFKGGLWGGLAINKKADPTFTKAFTSFLINMAKDPDPKVRRLQPLFKSVNARVTAVQDAEFRREWDKFLQIIKTSENKGWRKGYSTWHSLLAAR